MGNLLLQKHTVCKLFKGCYYKAANLHDLGLVRFGP